MPKNAKNLLMSVQCSVVCTCDFFLFLWIFLLCEVSVCRL